MRQSLLICLLLLTATHSLSAADARPREEVPASTAPATSDEMTYSPNWPEPPDTSGMLMRLGFGTVVTLALCIATLVLGRRWIQKQTPQSASRKLQIEESIVLGHRATLFLIKVGDSHLVAGTDAGGLKSLIVLPAAFQEVLDRHVDAAEPARPEIAPAPETIPWNANALRAA